MTASTSAQSAAATPELSSPIRLLYPDLEQELAITRRFLERYPDGKGDWRPHEKSMTIGRLASHVAELPGFGTVIAAANELDFAKGGYTPANANTAKELVAIFDEKVKAMHAALATMNFAALEQPWTLRHGEHVIVSGPKSALLRTLMISHITHHRAQLGVYYRLLGMSVPSTYGPSADEAA